MTQEQIFESLRDVYPFGMTDLGESWNEDADSIFMETRLGLDLAEKFDIAGYLKHDDPVLNSLRYVLCEIASEALGISMSEPWSVFDSHLKNLTAEEYEVLQNIQDNDLDRRYEFTIRHEVVPCKDGWQITTHLGGGWQDMWAATYRFTVSEEDDLNEIIRRVYPEYLIRGE